MLDLDPGLTPAYQPVDGFRLEAMGDVWVAYSPCSGQTHLLNDESAALLEWLQEIDCPGTTAAAAMAFASPNDPAGDTLAQRIEWAWVPLEQAGLIRGVAA